MHVFEDRKQSAVPRARVGCTPFLPASAGSLDRIDQVDDLRGMEERQHCPLVRFEDLILGQRRLQRIELEHSNTYIHIYIHTNR